MSDWEENDRITLTLLGRFIVIVLGLVLILALVGCVDPKPGKFHSGEHVRENVKGGRCGIVVYAYYWLITGKASDYMVRWGDGTTERDVAATELIAAPECAP